MRVSLHEGDIAQISADALITAINSSKIWFGDIDGVINNCAGNQFHAQAVAALDHDPSVKVVVASKRFWHGASFEDVVFIIDDLNEDLQVIVRRGLDAAAAAGYRTVSMPAIRLGVMKGFGGSQSDKVRAMVDAVNEYEREASRPLEEVKIIIFRDPALADEFARALA